MAAPSAKVSVNFQRCTGTKGSVAQMLSESPRALKERDE